MMRLRLLVVAALATTSLGVAAAPASACEPEGPPCCHESPIDQLWVKLTGDHLIMCW